MLRTVFIIVFVVSLLLVGCADPKKISIPTINKETKAVIMEVHVVEPYGLFNEETKNPVVTYKVATGNLVLSVLFVETAIVPIWLIGWDLYEPVGYDPDVKSYIINDPETGIPVKRYIKGAG